MPDSYSRAQTRESVESKKKWLEYESFEYESRLDPSLNRRSEEETRRLVGTNRGYIFFVVARKMSVGVRVVRYMRC